MTTEQAFYVPWRDRAFISINEAAVVVARTPGWVRESILGGRLEAAQVTPGGPMLVTVPSLARLVADAVPAASDQLQALRQRHARGPKAPALRLVADNPDPI